MQIRDSVTTMIHVRVNEDLKIEATDTLEKMGLSLSDAVRLLLTRIAAEKALPFEVRVPNRKTVAAMRAGDRGEVSKASSVKEMMAQLHADD
jgi:DNA-damage-inducible protein J